MSEFNWRPVADKPAFYDGCGFYAELSDITSAWKEGSLNITYVVRGKLACQVYPSEENRDVVFQTFLMAKQILPGHLATTVKREGE